MLQLAMDWSGMYHDKPIVELYLIGHGGCG